MAYAQGTVVQVDRSKTELDGLLARYGATQRGTYVDDEKSLAIVMFKLQDRTFRIEVPLPTTKSAKPKDGKEPRGWVGWTPAKREEWIQKQHQQSTRERWRAVVLMIKAKLESVAIGLSTVEREFLADLVMPDGRQLHTALTEDIKQAYLTGGQPKLLGA